MISYLRKIVFVLFIPCSVYAQNNILEWSENRKLRWDDFKGIIDSSNKIDDAMVNYGWKENGDIVGKDVTINIICYSSLLKSWARNTVKGSDYSLNHEQHHFDLAEVYARKMRQEISRLKIAKSTVLMDSINAIYKKYSDIGNKEEDRYDLETNHAINKKKQEEWNTYIDKMLKDLEEWKDTVVKLKLPLQTPR